MFPPNRSRVCGYLFEIERPEALDITRLAAF
jgi:hypothetical protein